LSPEKSKAGAARSAGILVVDDVWNNLQLMTGMLKDCGYKVRPAPSGKLALQAAQHDPPDLILLDINMPEMNGYEVCERLKADDKLAGIPVIFISALTEQIDKVRAFAVGGVDYLTKPIQMEELQARVETHLKLRRLQVELEQANAGLQKTNGALKDALAYAEGVVDTVREPLLVLGGDLRVQTANRSFYQAFRVSAAQTEGRLIYHLGDHQWDIPLLRKLLEEILPKHTSFDGFEVEHDFGAVGRKVMLLNARRFSQQSNPADLILLAIEDVTERRRAEEERREIETRFTSLVKNIKDYSIFTTDPDGRITSWNEAAERILGFSEAEILGRDFSIIFTPEDRQQGVPEQERRLAMEVGSADDERWHLHKNGQRFWAFGVVTPTYDAGGKHTGFSKILRDMTFRKKAEDELRRAHDGAEAKVLERTAELRTANEELKKEIEERKRVEEELRLRDRAFEAVAQGVLITDPSQPDNPIVYSNPAFEKITGYPRAEIQGRNCRFLQGPGTDPAAVDKVRAAIREKRPCLVELLNYRKDGAPFWNALSVAPVFDNGGALSHFVGLQTDVTSLKNLEQQLRQAQKMEAFGQLAGGVAHDFNNLLTVILGYSELMLASLPVGDPSREPIQEICNAGERAALLTRQLLAFSRKQVVEPQVLDLNSVVAGMEKMLKRLIGEDVELTAVPAPGLATVKADPGQVEQVLLNLAVNARDAMPQGGKITIETANVDLDEGYGQSHAEVVPGRYVLLAVSDTGCGMTEQVKAHIFEPFFTTKEVGKGTGLGLATVFGIVKQSGGHVRVYSEAGHGTTIKVYLPSVAEAVPAVQSIVEPEPARSAGQTILLVEDEKAVRAMTALALRSKGYTLLEAANGEEAVLLGEQHTGPIHLLMSDVVMPRMGGRQLAERLTSQHPEMRVLFVSGYTDDAVVRHGVLRAEVAFLQKPFTMDALHRKVQKILDGPN
jgi:PAS domain S-box-containing protein